MNLTTSEKLFAITLSLTLMGLLYAAFAITLKILYGAGFTTADNAIPSAILFVMFMVWNMVLGTLTLRGMTFFHIAFLYLVACVIIAVVLYLNFGPVVAWWHAIVLKTVHEVTSIILKKPHNNLQQRMTQ